MTVKMRRKVVFVAAMTRNRLLWIGNIDKIIHHLTFPIGSISNAKYMYKLSFSNEVQAAAGMVKWKGHQLWIKTVTIGYIAHNGKSLKCAFKALPKCITDTMMIDIADAYQPSVCDIITLEIPKILWSQSAKEKNKNKEPSPAFLDLSMTISKKNKKESQTFLQTYFIRLEKSLRQK